MLNDDEDGVSSHLLILHHSERDSVFSFRLIILRHHLHDGDEQVMLSDDEDGVSSHLLILHHLHDGDE
jgi:hypothetical protein